MDEILKKHWYSNFPRWLKIVLLIASIITVIYWLGVMIYKILCAIRVMGAFIFEKRNYWTFICCVAILLIGSLIMAQGLLGLDPIGKALNYLSAQLEVLREYIGGFIMGG